MIKISELEILRGNFLIKLPSFSLKNKEIIALSGSSGCGKSSILEVIGLVLKPQKLEQFTISYNNDNLDLADLIFKDKQKILARLRAEYFGFMMQTGGLLSFLNVLENIKLSSKILNKKLNQEWIDYLIDSLNISVNLLKKYPKQLSIGERQRISFIRALSHKPKVLLADEPTAALDPNNASALLNIVQKVVLENDISTIIISHDWQMIEERKIKKFKAEVFKNSSIFI